MPRFARAVPVHAAFLVGALLLSSWLGACGALGDRVQGSTGCRFEEASHPVRVAFCDTFDKAAASNRTRSGALDPTVWGVSEISVLDNPSQGLDNEFVPATAPAACGGGVLRPPGNIQICDGRLFDTADDGGSQSIVAMYPRQPFDIAGRTGDVTFDVSNDTQGSHAAWPAFVYTDQPVPAPYGPVADNAPDVTTYARNSFGFTMAGADAGGFCPTGQWTVDTMFETVDYALSGIDFHHDACVDESSNPTVMSHVEVQISAGQVTVWASDAGSSSLVEIAEAQNLRLPLTRGLIWIEDVHYNAGKYPPGQRDNTFGWDNVGFDGPILPRDRGFDVPGNTGRGRDAGSRNTGWRWDNAPLTVRTLPVDATSLARAQGALLEFNWDAYDDTVPTLSLNGNAPVSTAWPGGPGGWRTIAIPVPLRDIVRGRNTIRVEQARSAEGSIANFDLILQGAGGVPSCLDPSTCGLTHRVHRTERLRGHA